jgi:Holliday junction resolvase
MTPEGEVKQEVLHGLADIGAYYFMPVQTGFGKRTVDILACYKGRFIAIECKRAEGGKVTKIQKDTLDKIAKQGGISVVARCWADVWDAVPHD